MTKSYEQALPSPNAIATLKPYTIVRKSAAQAQAPSVALADDSRITAMIQSHVSPLSRHWLHTFAKRSLDVIGASLGLVLLAPLVLVTALAIKLESRGPVLFTQQRVGRDGKLFKLYKFRSMVDGADAQKATLAAKNEYSGVAFKIRADPRVTRIGRFIRKFSIDELPQLLNILKGEMSLVGPRPVVVAEALRYQPWQLRRFAATPGLTCLWQVSGRSNISFDDWMRLDLAYIDRWSLWLDLKLILKTVRVVLTAEGAY